MLLFILAHVTLAAPTGPVVEVATDNVKITESCRVRVPPGVIIPDADGNGVLHIEADGVTVEFEQGSVLRGAEINDNWDTLAGTAVRVDGHSGVTLKNLEVAGYKHAVYATGADKLTIDHANIRDCFRQRLHSTPQKEGSQDWLWPHSNDNHEWMNNYGGAIVVERSGGVTLSNITVRTTQNGILLDRVNGGSVFDCDCSFLSGWGLAMWRSNDNTVSRNAFDFCVRGHSEGVYNRGQDSAGILCFEQCSRNVFAENSVTHGGDGFFGFAGKEALGEVQPKEPIDHGKAGCNENILIGNDFSYAPAHGIEMTFSAGNKFIRNRIVENAICGVWGGYSRHTLIMGNHFEGNGGMAYGRERGGVNMEHGSDNVIVGNTFRNNLCGVHIWWDDDGKLLQTPLVKANDKGASNNVIMDNVFEITMDHPFQNGRNKDKPLIALELRDTGKGHVNGNVFAENRMTFAHPHGTELAVQEGIQVLKERPALEIPEEPKVRVLGSKTPVGARAQLRGRDKIVIGEWGPWDHSGERPKPPPAPEEPKK
jgi:parallel beta-helix repeat protein